MLSPSVSCSCFHFLLYFQFFDFCAFVVFFTPISLGALLGDMPESMLVIDRGSQPPYSFVQYMEH